MPRFFVEGRPQGEVLLGGEDGRHIVRSLRMRPGEAADPVRRAGHGLCLHLGLCPRGRGPGAGGRGVPQPQRAARESHRVPVSGQGGQAGDRHPKGGGAGGCGDLAGGERPVRGEAGPEVGRRKRPPACRKSPGKPPCKAAGASFPRWRSPGP